MPQANKPKVSVIIPAYNAERLIGETLKSVLSQTWSNLEVIVVNDGSTDRTAEIVTKFLSDNRVILITQPNKGCSAAKNKGLSVVTGTYIQYLDADDQLSSDKIEEQVEAIANNPFHIAVCRTRVFTDTPGDRGEAEIDSDILTSTDLTFEFVLNLYGLNGRQGMIQPNAFLISKKLSDAIGKWDTTISPAPDEDGEYFCRAMLKASRIVFTEKGINYYRKQNQSASLSNQVSSKHAKGGLLSIQLKASHLLNVENSKRVKFLTAKHFAEFIYMYASDFPELCKEAESNIYKLGLQRIPAVGGRYFKTIANIIGFGNALSAKNFMRELQQKTSIALFRKEISTPGFQAK